MTSNDSMACAVAPMLLPEFDPDPTLWERIRRDHARRIQVRRIRQFGGFGLGLALVAVVVTQGIRWSVDSDPGYQGISDGRVQSQRLQDQLESMGSQPFGSDVQARLRLVDNDLQAAYDHGADDSELKSLWALRNQLLESMVRQDTDHARLLTRI